MYQNLVRSLKRKNSQSGCSIEDLLYDKLEAKDVLFFLDVFLHYGS